MKTLAKPSSDIPLLDSSEPMWTSRVRQRDMKQSSLLPLSSCGLLVSLGGLYSPAPLGLVFLHTECLLQFVICSQVWACGTLLRDNQKRCTRLASSEQDNCCHTHTQNAHTLKEKEPLESTFFLPL